MQELRAALFAIRCFNIETGLVGETVKETGLLPIRMQWWKDAVNSVYRDKPVKHPVIQALAQVHVHPTTSANFNLARRAMSLYRGVCRVLCAGASCTPSY